MAAWRGHAFSAEAPDAGDGGEFTSDKVRKGESENGDAAHENGDAAHSGQPLSGSAESVGASIATISGCRCGTKTMYPARDV